MRIGIIGAGNMGATLAAQLTRLGHQVAIANSRGPATLAGVTARTGSTPLPVTQVTGKADVVIVAIPTPASLKASGSRRICATRRSRRSTPSSWRAWPASTSPAEPPDASPSRLPATTRPPRPSCWNSRTS